MCISRYASSNDVDQNCVWNEKWTKDEQWMRKPDFLQYFIHAPYFVGFFSFQYKDRKSCHHVASVFVIFNCVHASKIQVKITLLHMTNYKDAKNTVKCCKCNILLDTKIDKNDIPWWAQYKNDNIFWRSYAVRPYLGGKSNWRPFLMFFGQCTRSKPEFLITYVIAD